LLNSYFDHFARLLDTYPEDIACPEILRYLPSLLMHPATQGALAEQGRHVLCERVGGLTMLGYRRSLKSTWSQPHDHGRTWAIYGVVTGKTAMFDYELVEKFPEPIAVPGLKKKVSGKVRLVRSYWLMPGQCFWYPTGAIHSHHTYDDSRFVRLVLKRKELKPGGHRYMMISEENQ
jgi:hypothetical protein